ncbi:MAG: hypothetical protein N3A58_04550 [Spirochaetes bacterium]|nr:hypothetical protein [Spirochaetota bacterium]
MKKKLCSFFFFISISIIIFSIFSCVLSPSKFINDPNKYYNEKIKFTSKIDKIIYEEPSLYYLYEVKDHKSSIENIKYKFYVLSNSVYAKNEIINIQGKVFFIKEGNLKDENLKNEIDFFLKKFTNLNPSITSFYISKIVEILNKIYKNFKEFFLIISYGNYKVGNE